MLSLACVAVLVLAACGSDKKASTASGSSASSTSSSSSHSSAGSGAATIHVDNSSDELSFESISYFPNEVTIAAGTTLTFHSHFQGEPHTVTFGASIDKALKIFDALTPEQQNGPPPPEVEALKIPFVIPDDADFSDLANVKFNQSAAQPCIIEAGKFAPGAEPCPEVAAEPFDGTQTFYNSGLLKDDETFDVPLAEGLTPGDYSWICLFHGPEMRGKVTVVAKDDASAMTADDVETAGGRQLAEAVAKLKPELEKAKAEAKPGEVKAGIGIEDEPFGVMEFVPKEASIPVGGTITWNLSFHTVSFNTSEDARTDIVQDSDGTWHFNTKSFEPVGYTPPPPPADSGPPATDGGPPASDEGPPPPLEIDGGTFDGKAVYSSGSVDSEGDVLFSITFSTAGTYTYVCLIHPDMAGTVKVG
jgi:plastocyanin